jgi:hypothetical protein
MKGVGEAHVDLSDNALQSAAIEERVHSVVEVSTPEFITTSAFVDATK